MPDIICKWEILLTSLSILKSCFYSLLSLVFILFQKIFWDLGQTIYQSFATEFFLYDATEGYL